MAEKHETFLGRDSEGNRVYIPTSTMDMHMHVVGATGYGKSKFLEHLIREDFRDPDRGVCVIDPHGSLVEEMLYFAARVRPDLADRIVLLDFAGRFTKDIVGFHPFAKSDAETVGGFSKSVAKAISRIHLENSNDTPSISKLLSNIFTTLQFKEQSLLEVVPLIIPFPGNFHKPLVENLPNETKQYEWDNIFKRKGGLDYDILTGGVRNRFVFLTESARLRNIFGQTQNTLDLATCMNDGKILLVNLNSKKLVASEDDLNMVGMFLINEIVRCAKERDEHDPNLKPFRIYIDEFSRYLTDDIAQSLRETRKFKLYFTLAHQELMNLREENINLYSSVMTNCQCRVVFGGLSRDDATIVDADMNAMYRDYKITKDEIHRMTSVMEDEKRRIVRSNYSEEFSETHQSDETRLLVDFR